MSDTFESRDRRQGGISDQDVQLISNAMELKLRDVLDDNNKEQRKQATESRNNAVESVTGHSWENRDKVRNIIGWTGGQMDRQNRNRLIFGTVGIGLIVTAGWEKIVALVTGG